ncbi:MAG: hypothetical protein ACRELG_12125 [Gemmataceae bacterium]
MVMNSEREGPFEKDLMCGGSFESVMQMIRNGTLPAIDAQCDMILGPGESCYWIIEGCWNAWFYPGLVGRAGLVLQGTEWVSVRPDALVKKHLGTLYVTNRRICFVGTGRTAELPLKKVIQCTAQGDAVHISSKGRVTNLHFILEPGPAVALAQAVISKLASDVQREGR